MTEVWKPIPGYEGRYEVSSAGRVKSLARVVLVAGQPDRHIKERVLRARVAGNGYECVALHDHGQRTFMVHTLVALAFAGPRPEGMDVCHIDGDHLNNAAANLRYATRSANNYDQVAHGTHPHAHKTHCIHGHPFTAENTYHYRGSRHCRTCADARRARHAERKKAAA